MNRLQKTVNVVVWILIGILGVYILSYGVRGRTLKKAGLACRTMLTGAQGSLERAAVETLYPGLVYTAGGGRATAGPTEFLLRRAVGIFPVYSFLERQEPYRTEIESASAYEFLIAGGIHDENEIDRETGEGFDLAERMEWENETAAQSQQTSLNLPFGEALGTEYAPEQLADYQFLRNSFYTVENNTEIGEGLLNGERLLEMDMHLYQDASSPQILIYHTHSQEGFADSVAGDNSTTIVGVGEYLTELLTNTYGYNVIHNTSVFDFQEGELDRNRAYALAETEVEAILREHPSIEVVLDLHRDGVKEGTHLVADVNGKTTAQFMFFNGLSYSKRNGSISYLKNPYIGENLALSLQLKLACEKYFPGATRNIYLKSLRYNLHLRPKSLLVEAGAQTNTLEEVKNAMEPLAFVLHEVLSGE